MFINYTPTKEQLSSAYDTYNQLYKYYSLTDTLQDDLISSFTTKLFKLSNYTSNGCLYKDDNQLYFKFLDTNAFIEFNDVYYSTDIFELPTNYSLEYFLFIASLFLLNTKNNYKKHYYHVSLTYLSNVIIYNLYKITNYEFSTTHINTQYDCLWSNGYYCNELAKEIAKKMYELNAILVGK